MAKGRWIKGMRDCFFESLFDLARKDKDLILITADIGAVCHDRFKKYLPKQYINAGVAEQNMVSVAAGLALSGKLVCLYTIIPFITMRCYEQISVDVCCMNLPVTLVGIGAGLDYSTLGPTHHGVSDISIMRALPNMAVYSPSDNFMVREIVKESYKNRGPRYIRLDRIGAPCVYRNFKDIDLGRGFSVVKKGKDLYVVSTGRMVYQALRVAKRLAKYGMDAGVVDLFRLDRIDSEIPKIIGSTGLVVTLEEHSEVGGVGEMIASALINAKCTPRFLAIALENKFCRDYGSREHVLKANHLDEDSIVKRIKGTFES